MICEANWCWLISPQTDWNNECLVAVDRCYHSPEGARRCESRFTSNTGASDWAAALHACVSVCVHVHVWEAVCVHLWMGVVQTTKDGKNDFAVWTVSRDISGMDKKKKEACTGGLTRGGSGVGVGVYREFITPWHRVFPSRQLHNSTLWRGQILSVDPWCWNFLAKTSGSQLRPLQIRNYWNWTQKTAVWTCHESKAGQGGGRWTRGGGAEVSV